MPYQETKDKVLTDLAAYPFIFTIIAYFTWFKDADFTKRVFMNLLIGISLGLSVTLLKYWLRKIKIKRADKNKPQKST